MSKEQYFKELSADLHKFLVNTEELENIPERNDLLDLTEKLSQKIEDAISENRTLRIGVVGQVKAGKSSFINALLFDGKDILPKASTPMTAALTIIKYSEKLAAEVEFYSKADWGIIERNAQKFEKIVLEVAKAKQAEIDAYNKRSILNKKQNILEPNITVEQIIKHQDIFDEAKRVAGEAVYGAYELLELAKKRGLDFSKYIGTMQKIDDGVENIEDLVGRLHEYVGANGKFTPITRNITLYLNIETLKDIELVDTPGINDPIVSRGMATRDFLSRCDTVFLLSTSSQFMGQEDAEFLVNTLPAEGITNIILLGSKFDSVLVDEFKKYQGDIIKAMRDIRQKLSLQAENSLKAVIHSNPNKPIMEKLKNTEVKFISGICYNIAKKGRANLDEVEQKALENLEKRYNIKLDSKTLFDLANIDRIKDKELKKIKSQKDEILSNKLSDLLSGQSGIIMQKLDSLSKTLNTKILELGSIDINKLNQRVKYIETRLDKIHNDVDAVFADLSFNIEKEIQRLKQLIDNRKYEYLDIKIERRSRQESYEVPVEESFLIFFTRTVYKTRYRTVNYNVASPIDAAENAVMFVRLINSEVAEIWNKIVDIQSIESVEKGLIEAALKVFDLEDENFDKNAVINPVRNALRRITLKPLQIKDKEYRDSIVNYFSKEETTENVVEGSKIDQLREKVREVIYQICDDIQRELEKALEEIKIVLDEKAKSFVDSIKEQMRKEISVIERDLKNVDDAKNRYKNLITQVTMYKNKFER